MSNHNGYDLSRCAVCDVARHARPATRPPNDHSFQERPGDRWCGWCDDWEVNCDCDDLERTERDDDPDWV